MIKMELRGEKELLKVFERLKLDASKTFAAALVASAFPVVNDTKSNAPYKTGNLMRSYHIGTKMRNITEPQTADGAPQPVSQGAVAVVEGELRRGRKGEVLVGTDVVYAPPQEFLHKPHLRPALESNRGEVSAECKRAIRSMIQNAERRAK